jgi:hypothetical protein
MSSLHWKKSSFSNPNNCVELAWRKSSYSDPNDCVELAWPGELIAIRDSKNPDGPMLRFAQPQLAALISNLVGGQQQRV